MKGFLRLCSWVLSLSSLWLVSDMATARSSTLIKQMLEKEMWVHVVILCQSCLWLLCVLRFRCWSYIKQESIGDFENRFKCCCQFLDAPFTTLSSNLSLFLVVLVRSFPLVVAGQLFAPLAPELFQELMVATAVTFFLATVARTFSL